MTEIVVERKDLDAVVRLGGDIVAAAAAELRSLLRRAVTDGIRSVTLDFSAVAMVDSAGLGLLIAAHNSLQKVGGGLTVVHASKEILDLFHSMRIHRHFSVSGE